MHLLISPVAPLADQPDDFRWTNDGEVVMIGLMTCDSGCGCERSFTGLDSHKGTTVAVVADRDVTEEELLQMAADYCRRAGWDEEFIGDYQDAMRVSLEIAADLPVGQEVRIGRDADASNVVVYAEETA